LAGAGSGFSMDKPVLEKFAQTSQQRAQAFAQCLAEARQLTLSSGAFGHLPGVSGIYSSYENYVDACETGISQAGGVMSRIEEGMITTIRDYEAAESAATASAAAADAAAATAVWNNTIAPEQQITSPTQPAEPAP
jgi:hypothetical protein